MSLIRCIIIFAVTFSCVLTARGDEGADYYGDKPPVESIVLPGYSEEMARDRLSSTPMQPIEGIWEYPDEMMTLVIERFSSPQFSRKLKYRIVLLSADDMSLLPGTVIGYIAESADNEKFELWLYSELDGKILTGASKCVATLDSDGNSLTFVRNEIKMRCVCPDFTAHSVCRNKINRIGKRIAFITSHTVIEAQSSPCGGICQSVGKKIDFQRGDLIGINFFHRGADFVVLRSVSGSAPHLAEVRIEKQALFLVIEC